MGDIADAMIDGDMCQYCGEWIGDGAGYPQTCAACDDEDEIEELDDEDE